MDTLMLLLIYVITSYFTTAINVKVCVKSVSTLLTPVIFVKKELRDQFSRIECKNEAILGKSAIRFYIAGNFILKSTCRL